MAATKSAVRAQTQAQGPRNPNPMSVFIWTGTDKRGKKMKGEQLAKSDNLLRADLRRQGINPTTVKPKGKSIFGSSGSRISSREISIFSRQLATMMQSGIPMVNSFEIVGGGQKNPRMKTMLEAIRGEIEGGSTLHEAIGKHPVQFNELYRNLVKAGEGAGVLDTVLDTVATYQERIESLKGKIRKALYYPAAVIAVAFIVSAILLIFVVPQFEEVFKTFGADLPAFTQMLVTASRLMISYWWMVLLIVGGTIFGIMFALKRSQRLAHFVDRMALKLPIIGQILHQSAISRFARTLALTFKAGVPLVEALDTVAGATGSVVYSDAVKKIRDDVAVGYQLNLAMKQVNLFPHMVVSMVAIGEESGALDAMLFKVAEFYEEEVNNAVDSLASLLEPLIMVVIGTLVGSMVIGMYLPIFKLASTV